MIRTYDFASGELIAAEQARPAASTLAPETVRHCPAAEPRLAVHTAQAPSARGLPADLAQLPVDHFLASQR